MHRYISLAFAPHRFGEGRWPTLQVAQDKLTADLNLQTGEVNTHPGGLPAMGRPAVDGLQDIRCRMQETEEGPVSELSDDTGWSLSIPGELWDASCQKDLVVAVFALPGGVWTCVGLRRGQTQAPLRLPTAPRAHVVGPLVVCRESGFVHYFEAGDAAVSCTTFPVPGKVAYDARTSGDRLSMLAHKVVLDVDLSKVPRGTPHTCVPLECVRLDSPGTVEREPAVVVFVLPGRVLADHPSRGRVSLVRDESSPLVAKGDRVMLEDVREELPGVVKVHAWSKAGGAPSARPSAPPLELAAPQVQPMTEEDIAALRRPPPASKPGAAYLKELAQTHGFKAPPMLVQLLEECEADAVFARWLDVCGFAYFEVRNLTTDWDADPCLLAFAGNGGGDEYALYLYPPALAPTIEPPIVEFLHETNFSEYSAADFEAFLDGYIQDAVGDGWIDLELAEKIRSRLGLEHTDRDPGSAPDYLPVEDVEAEDPERGLVRAYLLNDKDAFDALLKLYAERQWSYPLSSLQSAIS